MRGTKAFVGWEGTPSKSGQNCIRCLEDIVSLMSKLQICLEAIWKLTETEEACLVPAKPP